jgi:hypothetical protein
MVRGLHGPHPTSRPREDFTWGTPPLSRLREKGVLLEPRLHPLVGLGKVVSRLLYSNDGAAARAVQALATLHLGRCGPSHHPPLSCGALPDPNLCLDLI